MRDSRTKWRDELTLAKGLIQKQDGKKKKKKKREKKHPPPLKASQPIST